MAGEKKIIVKNTFQVPSGLLFEKGEVFYGTWDCVSSIDKEIRLPNLVRVCNQYRGPYLLQKENFELSKG
jgi:hypothetical protein